MPEGFLRRWARVKSAGEPLPPAITAPPPREPAALPTLADVAQLGTDADFGRFVAPEVDSAVRRLALKKMFADPHFNAIDGLDIYMSDYTKPDPIPAAMMAALQHARSVFAGPDDDTGPDAARDPAEPPSADPAEPAPAAPAPADPASPSRIDPAEPAGTPAAPPRADEITFKAEHERTV